MEFRTNKLQLNAQHFNLPTEKKTELYESFAINEMIWNIFWLKLEYFDTKWSNRQLKNANLFDTELVMNLQIIIIRPIKNQFDVRHLFNVTWLMLILNQFQFRRIMPILCLCTIFTVHMHAIMTDNVSL